jgi:predicted nucleotidyltransferase
MTAADTAEALPADVWERVRDDPVIEFAVAFGSQAAGTADRSSDLDIAIKFADQLSGDERFRKRCQLSGRLQHPDAPFIDLSDLEELPLAVAHAAVNGELLAGDEASFRRYKRDIEREFERERDRLDRHRRDFIDRVAEEGLHG